MKTIIFLALFLISHLSSAKTNAASSRANGLLRFIVEQQGLRDLALSSVINNRCSRYLPELQKRPCKDAVRKMIALLDYDIIISDDKNRLPLRDESWTPRSFVFVAFKRNLITLLSDPKTSQYLNDLNQQLYRYLAENMTRPNIWEVTKTYFKNDYATAMTMATLFQDTSPMKLHLAWLERSATQGTMVFGSNKELLSRVIDTINLILDSSEEHYRELFYPEEIQRDLNRNIYHFYVPLYLAKALVREGADANAAYQAPLFLNLTYEFVTASSDYRFLYSDPLSISSEHKLKDIYGGYCGSNIGLRGMNFTKNFEALKASFQRSTEDAVQMLLSR